MARTKHNESSKTAPAPVKWVNFELSAAQKADLKSRLFSTSDADNGLTSLFEAGHKVTLKFDTYNKCYAAWLFPPDKGPNVGAILSSRGSTPMKALKQLLYLHYVVFEEIWPVYETGLDPEIDD